MMSVIFGILQLDRPSVQTEQFVRLGEATVRYGPDGTYTRSAPLVAMGFQAFYTHGRSHLEKLPSIDERGNMAVIDGRLDNFLELSQLVGAAPDSLSDSALVLKLYERLDIQCFARLVGDWAIALWSRSDRTMFLARDHAGARTVYFRNRPGELTWSTYLEAFAQPQDSLPLNKEFIARYLSLEHVSDQTPFEGIETVPPAHVVAVRDGRVELRRHWRWMADAKLIYKSDAEYDEQFRHLFSQAVERRAPRGEPVIAELSGGLDSSSIVCMSDHRRRPNSTQADLVDTVSYFDDTEPDWNEQPYFETVEKQRRKRGIHIDVAGRLPKYEAIGSGGRIYPYVMTTSFASSRAALLDTSLGDKGYRTIISGYGGDELLGGLPTPLPELADHLRFGRLSTLLRRNAAWCLSTGQPFVPSLLGSLRYTAGLYIKPQQAVRDRPNWLGKSLSEFSGSPFDLRRPPGLLRAIPSAIASGRAFWALLEMLPHLTPPFTRCYEYRYPYLDRELVEFLQMLPREQLVQPGHRRSLMRRALKQIVPSEILERKRKARISRGPIVELREARRGIEEMFSNSLAVDLGFVDRTSFIRAFTSTLQEESLQLVNVIRTVTLELWLKDLSTHICLKNDGNQDPLSRADYRVAVAEI